jgi:DNA polymerase III delta subunit
MAKKPDKFPSLLVVSGSEVLLRRRFLKHIKATQLAAGWGVEDVDGSDSMAVRDVLDGGMFVVGNVLGVVHTPQKMDLDLLAKHHAAKDYEVTLLLHIEGEPDGRTKFGKFVKKLGNVHKGFPKASEWDAPKVAAKFIHSEVKDQGMTIRPALASALVSRVGSDLGMLAFEVQKMVLLAQTAGVTAIEAEQVKGAMAPIAEAAVAPIMDALATRNRKRLSKALAQIRRTSRGDPTMRICRFLGSSVTRWVQAAHLDNLPPRAAAGELGINPWFFENKVLPPARLWGKAGTVRLAADLAASERAVLNGAVSPWTVLTARLLAAC